MEEIVSNYQQLVGKLIGNIAYEDWHAEVFRQPTATLPSWLTQEDVDAILAYADDDSAYPLTAKQREDGCWVVEVTPC